MKIKHNEYGTGYLIETEKNRYYVAFNGFNAYCYIKDCEVMPYIEKSIEVPKKPLSEIRKMKLLGALEYKSIVERIKEHFNLKTYKERLHNGKKMRNEINTKYSLAIKNEDMVYIYKYETGEYPPKLIKSYEVEDGNSI